MGVLVVDPEQTAAGGAVFVAPGHFYIPQASHNPCESGLARESDGTFTQKIGWIT